MRTYVSPIGYDTRRVTRPVVNTGLGPEDVIVLLRPNEESDTEQATQAVADVKQLLQEIEPRATCSVERISVESFETTVRDCCTILAGADTNSEVIVSLGGGPRDILLPLTVTALAFTQIIDQALFFSDLDSTVQEWPLPDLTAQIPNRTKETFEAIAVADDWLTLSTIADETGQSKSTVIRHVNDLEDAGIVEANTTGKAKRVQVAFSGELLSLARAAGN
ncbi:CRISPR-associated CARF protein Csa3 [Halobacteria archaeon AArc-m2/3/4]|uniref:CRISPR-associated CARF protein Csa3 n=1 Tax=Natronoglomus mannanivorans TaxID=2979990 RepID=A0ABT2QJD7_9EURY|nr:CRISPR-associated CARF protein Csa3 [Halobacteria archaeon AArc-m2/3/4]